MKVDITGASNFVNRMFEACGAFQWAREFVRNSIEAGATRVEFGLEWEAVEAEACYRRTISDDGCGMTGDELLTFFRTLGAGGKKIGGVHDNFGVGAKIASLPWNPQGVVVISYKDGVGSLIWIMLDEESGEYEVVEFGDDETTACVIEPDEIDGVHWDRVAPEWAREHGTTIVLLGSEESPHTMLGNPRANEAEIKKLSMYLNTRFWEFDGVDITVRELRGPSVTSWPLGPDDDDDNRRLNNRSIRGARYYLDGLPAKGKGKPHSADSLVLADGKVKAEWYLWEGERPHVHNYAQRHGYLAVRYDGELFFLTNHKAHFRWFGIVESAVQKNLTIILEPQQYDAAGDGWGVHPDQSRNRLIFSGDGDKGVEIPLAEWGLEFAENMPEAIREAIKTARGELEGTIDDSEYRSRLQDRFGDRWRIEVPISGKRGGTVGDETEEEQDVIEGPGEDVAGEPSGSRKKRKDRRARKKVQKVAAPGATQEGGQQSKLLDIPKYRFALKADFEREWHIALWSPNDPGGPTVFINQESPILEELVAYHQARYPDVFAEQVADSVRAVMGEVAVAKVAHTQKLSRHIPREELDADYRSERALTTALMGLIAEDSLIVRRLAGLGRSKSVA